MGESRNASVSLKRSSAEHGSSNVTGTAVQREEVQKEIAHNPSREQLVAYLKDIKWYAEQLANDRGGVGYLHSVMSGILGQLNRAYPSADFDSSFSIRKASGLPKEIKEVCAELKGIRNRQNEDKGDPQPLVVERRAMSRIAEKMGILIDKMDNSLRTVRPRR